MHSHNPFILLWLVTYFLTLLDPVIVGHGGASAVVRLECTPFGINASPMFCHEPYEGLMLEQAGVACAMHGADRILLHSDVYDNHDIWTVII